ncbi:MAG: NRDE family protein [Bacteroidota bacterium]|nr:NRDE family protein [Bacteroidota bacterium]
MCLILFSWDQHEKYKLVLAANRDEFYSRPTRKAHYWEESPQVFAGKDLVAGGSWMGISKSGKFAAITNYRDLKNSKPASNYISRGNLIANYIKSDYSPFEFLKSTQELGTLYDGFNLLVGDFHDLYFFSNVENEIKKLESGIYGLSNHLLNTPWPKVLKGKQLLKDQLSIDGFKDDKILNMLINIDHAEDKDLPDTGLELSFERSLSPMFIKMDDYGTRSSTLLKISRDGKYSFHERTFENGVLKEEASEQLNLF